MVWVLLVLSFPPLPQKTIYPTLEACQAALAALAPNTPARCEQGKLQDAMRGRQFNDVMKAYKDAEHK